MKWTISVDQILLHSIKWFWGRWKYEVDYICRPNFASFNQVVLGEMIWSTDIVHFISPSPPEPFDWMKQNLVYRYSPLHIPPFKTFLFEYKTCRLICLKTFDHLTFRGRVIFLPRIKMVFTRRYGNMKWTISVDQILLHSIKWFWGRWGYEVDYICRPNFASFNQMVLGEISIHFSTNQTPLQLYWIPRSARFVGYNCGRRLTFLDSCPFFTCWSSLERHGETLNVVLRILVLPPSTIISNEPGRPRYPI
jgi:hypothetical protein